MPVFKAALKQSLDITYLACLALWVGVLSGLGAVGFSYLIGFFHNLFFIHLKQLLGGARLLLFPLSGCLGGLAVGALVYFLAGEARGHGVPQVIYAVARQGGKLRGRVVLIKAITAALTIGSGGSAGREGPIAQIGAALGSTLGQVLRLPEQRLVTLVLCGVGGGIAATFNAPVAGALYALEVIRGGFNAEVFGYVLITAFTADLLARSLLGNLPVFSVSLPELPLHPPDLLRYAVLGVVAAVVAYLFMRSLYGWEDLFDGLRRVPGWVKPALGGIIFGLCGLLLPQTLGRGEQVTAAILGGHLQDGWLLFLLCLAKLFTTSVTLGSGGSGGVLFPALFLGASLGGALGSVAGGPAYALVGMGALFAAVNQAPFTAILLVLEITTHGYRLVLPLMLACGLATITARALSRETIDTMKLARQGIWLSQVEVAGVLQSKRVREVMSAPVQVLVPEATLEEAGRLMRQTGHNGFPVVDDAGSLVGVLTLGDLRRVKADRWEQTKVGEVMTRHPLVATPDENLEEVSHRLAAGSIGRLPVVASRRVVGIVTRSDIIACYRPHGDTAPG